MKLREEYELGWSGHHPWHGKEILYDEQDSFAYMTKDKHGNLLVVGWNRNTEIWWRNQNAD